MPLDTLLVARVRAAIPAATDVVEKKMFGGMAFMINGHMGCGVMSDGHLMVRVAPEDSDTYAAHPYASVMVHGGRRMRGFIRVDPAGLAEADTLSAWVRTGVDFVRSLPPK